MNSQLTIEELSVHLFWDVNRKNLDLDKNKTLIITRVLEYGLWSDWQLVKQYYGIAEIGKVASQIQEIDNKTIAFVSFLSKIPVTDFICYNIKQSKPQHWNF